MDDFNGGAECIMGRCRLFMATVIRQANQDLIQYNVATAIDMMFTSACVGQSVNTSKYSNRSQRP